MQVKIAFDASLCWYVGWWLKTSDPIPVWYPHFNLNSHFNWWGPSITSNEFPVLQFLLIPWLYLFFVNDALYRDFGLDPFFRMFFCKNGTANIYCYKIEEKNGAEKRYKVWKIILSFWGHLDHMSRENKLYFLSASIGHVLLSFIFTSMLSIMLNDCFEAKTVKFLWKRLFYIKFAPKTEQKNGEVG